MAYDDKKSWIENLSKLVGYNPRDFSALKAQPKVTNANDIYQGSDLTSPRQQYIAEHGGQLPEEAPAPIDQYTPADPGLYANLEGVPYYLQPGEQTQVPEDALRTTKELVPYDSPDVLRSLKEVNQDYVPEYAKLTPEVPTKAIEDLKNLPPQEEMPEAQLAEEGAPSREPAQVEGETIPKPMVPEETDMEKYAQSLKDQEDEMKRINLLRSLSGLGAAISGPGATKQLKEQGPVLQGDESLAKLRIANLEKLLGEKRKEVYTDQARVSLEDSAVYRDPNSALSELYRGAVERYMPEAADSIKGFSAWELKEAGYEPDRLLNVKERRELKKLEADAKEEVAVSKKVDELHKELDPAQYRAGQFAKLYEIQNKAKGGLTLVEGQDLDKLTGVQIRELASVLDSVLKGGVGTITGTEKLVPKTARGSWTAAIEWATNNPKAARQGGFAKVLTKALERANDRVSKEIQSIQSKRARSPKYDEIRKDYPEKYETLMNLWGLNPDGTVPSEANREGSSLVNQDGWNDDKEKRYQELMAKKAKGEI